MIKIKPFKKPFAFGNLQEFESIKKSELEVSDRVKIKNKRGQSAINAKERLELKYSDKIGDCSIYAQNEALYFDSDERKKNRQDKKLQFLQKIGKR